MLALDLLTGREISICQPLGSGAMACKLDAGGLAEAAVAVARAISEEVDLLVINKFSKQEASGKGLRTEFAEAIMAGVPVLTAVPEKCLDDWRDFTGDIGTTLLCERQVVEGWWRDLSQRIARGRAKPPRRPTRPARYFPIITSDDLITAETLSPTFRREIVDRLVGDRRRTPSAPAPARP